VLNAVFHLPGGEVVQSIGAAELRIKKASRVAPKPAEAGPKEAPARPPTRLEKLRAEHAKKVGAEGGDR